MIRLDGVSVRYGDERTVLRDVDLTIEEGELCLVAGPTGSGKSSLLGVINGLVPHFTGGHLGGSVVVDGRDTRTHPPKEMADLVGVVGQDPLAGFVADVVEDELAYGMEQLAVAPGVMRKRVEETLDLLGIAELRRRPMRTLSGGQQQRVAIGAALIAQPRVLVLDEPTSALDPTAAEDVLAAVTRLVHDLGVTVVIAEHRLERVLQFADRIIYVTGDGAVRSGPPAEIMPTVPLAPPVVALGQLFGWEPLPLSVRDARRRAVALRAELARVHPPARSAAGPAPGEAVPRLTASRVVVRYGQTIAVREVSLELFAGEVAAVMGRNGSGKSSLLWTLQGAGERAAGRVLVGGRDPHDLPARAARAMVGLVPQTPTDLLYLLTVDAECAQADADAYAGEDPADAADGPADAADDQADGEGRRHGPGCRALLDRLAPGIAGDQHPRDLSEGQRLALALAIQLTASPDVILLDEPTRGLDYRGKDELARTLADLAREGRAVLVATHDVEFVAIAARRVILLAEGEVVADGPTEDVLIGSPMFAPQVAKVLHPEPWLTVAEVAEAAGPRPLVVEAAARP